MTRTILEKRVNVYPGPYPIHGTSVPLNSNAMGIMLSVGDIRHCITKGAKVEEILGKNKTVILTLSNFNKDNSVVEEKEEKEPTPTKVVDVVPPNDTSSILQTGIAEVETTEITKNLGTPIVVTKNTVKDEKVDEVKNLSQVNPSTIKKAAEKINQIKK